MLSHDPYSLPYHSFFVTFFPDKFAKTQSIDALTLDELADLIAAQEGSDKAKMPWLKLARFGGNVTDKGSLRSNANMLDLTGIEAEHDAGTMSFEAAVATLQAIELRCIVYTTPSYRPGEKERWRVLAPLSETLPTTERAALVARLNGALGGVLADESFTLSQAYLYGHLSEAAFAVEVIDGDFIDLADDLEAGAIGKRRVGHGAGRVERPRASGEIAGYSDDQLQAMLEQTRIKGFWHNNMCSVASALAGRGRTLDEICTQCGPYANLGADDPELVAIAKSAVDKFGFGLDRETSASLSKGILKLKADTEAPEAPKIMFTPPTVVTQDAIALVFAERFADQLQFDHHAGAWYAWTGSHWEREDTLLAFQYCRELGREASKGATPTGMKEARKIAFAGGVEKFARADRKIAVTSERWDRDSFLLGTPDGTVNLHNGILRPAAPEEGITRLTAVTPSHEARCPLWLAFLGDTFSHDMAMVRFVRQWFGYCLTGDTREHALWFGFGNGGNGKGVMLNTIRGIMGGYATTAPMDTFTAVKFAAHPTEIAMLRGARMVTASETERGRAWAESRIKQLTGGDPVSARFMHKDFFEFRPEFKLTLIGNHKPVLRSVDDAVRRRFNLIPFMNKPAVIDRQLEFKLRAEWPGILRWLIEGCLDWQANGLTRPDAVLTATENYFADQDLMGQWLEDCCEQTPRSVETTAALFVSWEDFAHKAGEYSGSRKAFTTELGRRGFEQTTLGHSKARSVQGVRLKQSQLVKNIIAIVPKTPE
jgi:P4 family phage/plasmid primase-like protien